MAYSSSIIFCVNKSKNKTEKLKINGFKVAMK